MPKPLVGVLLALSLLVGAGCGPQIDLKSVVLDETFTGWYDYGPSQGMNKLVPSISFRLKNAGPVPLTQIQLTVSFWQQDADGEIDSKDITGIGAAAVAPGASSDPVFVHSDVGYTLPQPQGELFTNSEFKDFVVKLFARRNGKILKLGEFTVEHRIIPHATTTATVARP
jgi:hypothetical protein